MQRPMARLFCVLAFVACHRAFPGRSSASRAWPELPRNEADARAVLEHEQLRAETPSPAGDHEGAGLLHALEERWGTVTAGTTETRAWVQAFLDGARGHDAYVLFGTFHDSAGQIDAFRRLVGPGGLRGVDVIAAEQFRGGGAWLGVSRAEQSGDDGAIRDYVEGGDPLAFDVLRRRHRESDYAAWKYDYSASVLDLLVATRALRSGDRGPRFTGCDMPTGLQGEIAGLTEETRRSLRELHCARKLETMRAGETLRVAMVWGQAHVETLRRFLPPSASVLSLYVFGSREGDETTEAALAKRLVLTAPLLVPLGGREDVAALLLPDPLDRSRIDRVHEPDAGARAITRITVEVTRPARFTWEGATFDVHPDQPKSIDWGGGERPYRLDCDGVTFAGSLGGSALEYDVVFDPTTRSVRWNERGAR